MAQYDATELVDLVKRRALVPGSQGTFSSAEILLALTEAIESRIAPSIIETQAEHLVASKDITIVSGQAAYRVPYRAMSNGIRSIHWLMSDGRSAQLVERKIRDVANLRLASTTGTPAFYVVQGPHVVLYPTPGSAVGTLRVKYHMRPNRIVPVTSVRAITAIALNTPDASSTRVTVAAVPASMEGFQKFDFVRAKQPHDILSFDVTPSVTVGASATTVTFAEGDLSSELEVNDYLCLARETPMANIVDEFVLPAALRAGASLLKALGFLKQAAALDEEAGQEEKVILSSMVSRNKDETQDITNDDWF